jgi:hypothetical protein
MSWLLDGKTLEMNEGGDRATGDQTVNIMSV